MIYQEVRSLYIEGFTTGLVVFNFWNEWKLGKVFTKEKGKYLIVGVNPYTDVPSEKHWLVTSGADVYELHCDIESMRKWWRELRREGFIPVT
jgi:hypothetical protein